MAKIALLIGVSEYQSGLNPLPSAVKDVEAMQRVLVNPEMGGFDKAEIAVLKNPAPQEIRDAIYNLFADRQKDDRPSVRQKSLIQKSKVQKRYKPLDCRASLATLRDLFMENEKYVFREECNQVILRPYYKPRPPRIANGASRFIYGVLTFDF